MSEYEGKYAFISEGEQEIENGYMLAGFESANWDTGEIKLPQIRNGTVTVPWWIWEWDEEAHTERAEKRYYGNDEVYLDALFIIDSETININIWDYGVIDTFEAFIENANGTLHIPINDNRSNLIPVTSMTEGNIVSGVSVWHSFNVIGGTTYYVYWGWSYYDDFVGIYVRGMYSDNTIIFSSWGSRDYDYDNNRYFMLSSFTAAKTDTVLLEVRPSFIGLDDTGVYVIGYSTTMP